jgi:hypothetical protein
VIDDLEDLTAIPPEFLDLLFDELSDPNCGTAIRERIFQILYVTFAMMASFCDFTWLDRLPRDALPIIRMWLPDRPALQLLALIAGASPSHAMSILQFFPPPSDFCRYFRGLLVSLPDPVPALDVLLSFGSYPEAVPVLLPLFHRAVQLYPQFGPAARRKTIDVMKQFCINREAVSELVNSPVFPGVFNAIASDDRLMEAGLELLLRVAGGLSRPRDVVALLRAIETRHAWLLSAERRLDRCLQSLAIVFAHGCGDGPDGVAVFMELGILGRVLALRGHISFATWRRICGLVCALVEQGTREQVEDVLVWPVVVGICEALGSVDGETREGAFATAALAALSRIVKMLTEGATVTITQQDREALAEMAQYEDAEFDPIATFVDRVDRIFRDRQWQADCSGLGT